MKIVITGGASGLGAAITEKLAQDSDNFVLFTFNSSQQSAALLETRFKNTKGLKVDFNDESSIDTLLEEIDRIQPDVLINNGITGFIQNHFHKIDPKEFITSFERNIFPVIKITQKFITISRKRKSGKIITILSSAIVNKPQIGWSEYTANKSYLHMLSKSWAVENAPFGITSNCISPSFMDTKLTGIIDRRLVETIVQGNPNKKLLTEGEVADAVYFLVFSSPQINGINMIINAASDLV